MKPRAPRRLALLSALCVGIVACASDLAPQTGAMNESEGTPSRGLTIAQETCAACHAIAAGQAWSPNPTAPTFESIANTPGMTSRAFNVWLHSSHPTMPDLLIDQDRIDDLWAYMATLKRAD